MRKMMMTSSQIKEAPKKKLERALAKMRMEASVFVEVCARRHKAEAAKKTRLSREGTIQTPPRLEKINLMHMSKQMKSRIRDSNG